MRLCVRRAFMLEICPSAARDSSVSAQPLKWDRGHPTGVVCFLHECGLHFFVVLETAGRFFLRKCHAQRFSLGEMTELSRRQKEDSYGSGRKDH